MFYVLVYWEAVDLKVVVVKFMTVFVKRRGWA